ncbi:MAG TPA: hypothetical protein VD995_25285 [Azospirillum sp.]|nr:hypothetical protein [Azospirillum sp.]
MTQELRILMFSDEEVAQAIVLYLRRQGISSPQGRVSVLAKSGHPRVEVRYAVGFGEESLHEAITGESLAGALVLYCIEKHIPLRRDAQKILHLVDDKIVLILNQHFPTTLVVRMLAPPAKPEPKPVP